MVYAGPAQIFVSVAGADTNIGSKEKPVATVHMALRKAREMRRLKDTSAVNGIDIIVGGGVYTFFEPLFIRPEDAGTKEAPLIIRAAAGESPVFSGGVTIRGWKKVAGVKPGLPKIANGKLWVADAPFVGGNLLDFRQMYVGDFKAIRARFPNADSMGRILGFDRKSGTCDIPLSVLAGTSNVAGLEMVIHQWWAIANLRIKSIKKRNDTAQLVFHQPESRIQSEHPWPAPWISKETGNSAFYLTNGIEFLDAPGEWFLDKKNARLYYWPAANVDLLTAQVIAPAMETLLNIQGNADAPVSFVNFRGIAFKHTTWMRPSLQGHVPHQAGMYMLDAYSLKTPGTPDKKTLENQAWVGRPPAAVTVNFASNTAFENCFFQQLASTGVDYHKGVHDNLVQGNLFKEVGGNAILAGVYSDEATEIHLPYSPKDERDVCSGIQISNNLITNVTNEDWGCVAIGLGYTKNSTVSHNEIEDVHYSGISMGWGWSPTANVMKNNRIIANKIHHFGKSQYDCAGIYTLSPQPGSVISDNYVDSIYKAPYAHLPTHWFYLYTDEGSSFITVKDNWTPSTKYLQNANGPGNKWINNGPLVAAVTRDAAGLQQGYQWLLNYKNHVPRSLPVNKERNEMIELVVKENQILDLKKLKSILLQNSMDTACIYRWQDHYMLYTKVQDITVMQGRLQNNFPEVTVKVFHDLFYEFNRSKCSDKNTAVEWDHILLTADLVADEKLQQEYLNYHATQFEKWPEISKGFCNADFQQLLLFKNGRQLVLVISIPKGARFDNLNPKTMENNPRVEDWNAIMKKYQQGIAGTKKGETWVFLKQL